MILVVGHEKGGVGKSALSVNLAYRISQEGASVIVVDTDRTASSLGWYGRRSEYGVEPSIPVLQNIDNPAPAIVDLSGKYGAVICDIGARDYAKLRTLARIADLWIAPTKVGQSDMDSTIDFLAAIRKMDPEHKRGKVPVVVGLNAVSNKSEEEDAREYLQQECEGIVLLKASLKDRKVWRDSSKAGRSVYEMPKRDSALAVDEFEALYLEALTHVSK